MITIKFKEGLELCVERMLDDKYFDFKIIYTHPSFEFEEMMVNSDEDLVLDDDKVIMYFIDKNHDFNNIRRILMVSDPYNYSWDFDEYGISADEVNIIFQTIWDNLTFDNIYKIELDTTKYLEKHPYNEYGRNDLKKLLNWKDE